jgi:hypothetical protein
MAGNYNLGTVGVVAHFPVALEVRFLRIQDYVRGTDATHQAFDAYQYQVECYSLRLALDSRL